MYDVKPIKKECPVRSEDPSSDMSPQYNPGSKGNSKKDTLNCLVCYDTDLTGKNEAIAIQIKTPEEVAGLLSEGHEIYWIEGFTADKDYTTARLPLDEFRIPNALDQTPERLRNQASRLEAKLERAESTRQLSATVAHDLNNILTAINGYTELLDEYITSPVGMGHRERILSAVASARDYTQCLLGYIREIESQSQNVDIDLLITNMQPILRQLLGKGIVLDIDIEEGLGAVEMDPCQLEQTIISLTTNAKDAMSRGGEFKITASNQSSIGTYLGKEHLEAGEYVVIETSDTGCGMDSKTLQRVFEPFFSTKEKGKGAGVGMSSAHRIVKDLGGNISVFSEVGRGTIFAIYLPRKNPEDGATVKIPRTEEGD